MQPILAILGPTATGKSRLALRLAQRIGAEILSADSMQVYRGMDIGTAKPSSAEQQQVMHHMVDLVEPEAEYHVAAFQQQAREVIENTASPVLLVGGSYLHFRAVVDPLCFQPHDSCLREKLAQEPLEHLAERLQEIDSEANKRVDLSNLRRVLRALEIWQLTRLTPTDRANTPEAQAVKKYRSLLPVKPVGIEPSPDHQQVIRERLEQMMQLGFLEEVRTLSSRMGRTARQAVGYQQLLEVVAGQATEDEAVERAFLATRSLAKDQLRWFRSDPRIQWVTQDPDLEKMETEILTRWQLEQTCSS